ncbi:MAG TPA: ABC transporter ATP-binding protein [Gemmatimonas sp.]|uniref:ABC transporter ATP-binding protein n=1 Tax=Gemmatimonas sp. TaxID=1962908 RepID=UPI002EDB5BA4
MSNAMDADAVVLRDVSFAYRAGTPVVARCSLRAPRGRILALLGPNGSGKTTLLKLIAGALAPDQGVVERAGLVGYVPQLLHLSFAYSVLDVVLMGRARKIGLFATPSRRDVDAAMTALGRVGMKTFADRSFDELSGGERQLVALARALAADAEILVLDEPTSALDLRHQEIVLRWMQTLVRDDGLTIVFSTHQPQHADAVAHDVALVHGPGRVDVGPAEQMLEAGLVGSLFGVAMRRVVANPQRDPEGTLVVDFAIARYRGMHRY